MASTASLSRTAWLLTGSAAEADDLVQEALIRTYTAWHRVRRENALGYARRTLVNRHVDRWRSSRRELTAWAFGHRTRDLATTPHVSSDDRDELVRLLQLLRPRERAVVVLRYYYDLSENQVAGELGISTGTVKSTASRAIAKLRDLRSAGALHDADDAPPASRALPATHPTPAASRALPRIAVRTNLPAAAGAAGDHGRTS
jgi:RNA polymerase sigma-70 factor (sigma-E family)